MRHYLEGSKHPIEVWTDHQNLQSFMKQPRLNGRQARWCFHLTPYDFTIRYRKGAENPADGPSRRPDYGVSKGRDAEEHARGVLATLDEKIAWVRRVRVTSIRRILRESEYQPKRRNTKENQPPKHACQLKQLRGPAQEESECQPRGLKRKILEGLEGQPRELKRKLMEQQARGTVPGDRESSRHESLRPMTAQAKPLGRETEEADHLLRVVQIQTITRTRARKAVQDEEPMKVAPSEELLRLVKAAQEDDSYARLVQDKIEAGKAPPSYQVDEQGILRYERKPYVPNQRSLIGELLRLHHDDEHAGHWGVEKTTELLRRKFRWKGMKADIEEYVRTCPVCQGNAISNHKPYGELQSLPRPTRPWKDISVDWITGLPKSATKEGEKDAILVIVDRYSRMGLFVACNSTMDAAEFAETMYREVDMRFGPPTSIVSDRDSRITSAFWKEVCAQNRIKRRISTAYHPQTDGQTEALNRSLENYLRAYVNLETGSWANLLITASFAYNNSYNHSLKMTPFRCVYGWGPGPDYRYRGRYPRRGDTLNQRKDTEAPRATTNTCRSSGPRSRNTKQNTTTRNTNQCSSGEAS